MTINPWRLSGGLGVDADPPAGEQVMLQGIGFPLRPVDNVPTEDTPNLGGIVDQGIFMSWNGLWREGVIYPKGSQVRDGLYIMLAVTDTFDPAAPQNSGDPSWSVASFAPATSSNVSTVVCGHTYTMTADGWFKAIRVWIPALTDANISYRLSAIITVDGDSTTTVQNIAPGSIGQWVPVALVNDSVLIGTVVTMLLETINSGAHTSVDGGWQYQGQSNAGIVPNAQSWTIDNGRTSFRINKFDLDGTDRSTELEGVIPESDIFVVQTSNTALSGTYRVTSVVDSGLYMSYAVVLVNETGGGPKGGEVTTVEIDVPIPLATEYSEDVATWPAGNPAWATVESVLRYDGVDQGVTTSAFGVDVEFQPAEVSQDWDIIVAP